MGVIGALQLAWQKKRLATLAVTFSVVVFLTLLAWFWQENGVLAALAVTVSLGILTVVVAHLFLAAYRMGRRAVTSQETTTKSTGKETTTAKSDLRPRYIRDAEYVAASAWSGRSAWAEKSGDEPAP